MNSKELIKNIYVVIESDYDTVCKGRLSAISKIVNIWKKDGVAWEFSYDKCKLPIILCEDGSILMTFKRESNLTPTHFTFGSVYPQYSMMAFSSIAINGFRQRKRTFYMRIENRFMYWTHKIVKISLYFKVKRNIDTLAFELLPIEDKELDGIQYLGYVNKYNYRLSYSLDELELRYGN